MNSPPKGQWRGALMFSLNKRLSKQWWGWWFETPSLPLWYHCNGKFLLTSCCLFIRSHYTDVLMSTTVSQITSLTVVYSTVYSDADGRKHQSSASLAFVWGINRDRWIPRTKDQLRGKCFHLMTSSCTVCRVTSLTWGDNRRCSDGSEVILNNKGQIDWYQITTKNVPHISLGYSISL